MQIGVGFERADFIQQAGLAMEHLIKPVRDTFVKHSAIGRFERK
jgi:hypothetical protein